MLLENLPAGGPPAPFPKKGFRGHFDKSRQNPGPADGFRLFPRLMFGWRIAPLCSPRAEGALSRYQLWEGFAPNGSMGHTFPSEALSPTRRRAVRSRCI